ncbi:unnamed protein product [Caenorhabditis auriculariae]|uniref:Glutathione synthetase n=1 Tax=Caenorhabditis auriculariae TaxID=2777116 RepID=A0A8S1HK59_9PELO|nr:unnamed protein product [Caenorhabditis auriculariae]
MSDSQDGRILLADYPKLPLPEDRTDFLVQESLDFAHAHGLVMRTPQHIDRSDVCQNTPIALLPSAFPRNLFEKAVNVQNLIAALYHEVAYDYDFLMKTHEQVIKTDVFTKNLVEIFKKVQEEGNAQPVSLAIQRSDYMCHKDQFSAEYTLKQIEVNNIASSMGAHAERVSKMHYRNMSILGYEKALLNKSLPKNEPISMIAEALFVAWKHFDNPAAVVLVVVETVNQNQIDQRVVEYELEKLGVPPDQIVRRDLNQCNESLRLSETRGLMYHGSFVAVVYFRAGYSPDHYPTQAEWDARLLIERSTAIKAPWIGLQLANTKKTQQVLAEDGAVERFIGHPREAAAIRSTFAGLWAIDQNDPLTRKIVQGAINHPSRFVLKPQLEGGGGNFYGEPMAEKLKTLEGEERGAYILMERLQPLVVENYLIRANQPHPLSKCVSELGIYGYAFGKRGECVTKTGGHLLRTKGETVDEGGVAVGAAVIDSPFLYDQL